MLYGIAGLGLAIVLSLGAFAVAGRRLSNPGPTINISGLSAHRSADRGSTWTPRWSPAIHNGHEGPASSSPTVAPSAPSPPPDDDATSPGSDDHGGGDDERGAGDD
jgi:hypothetical protein